MLVSLLLVPIVDGFVLFTPFGITGAMVEDVKGVSAGPSAVGVAALVVDAFASMEEPVWCPSGTCNNGIECAPAQRVFIGLGGGPVGEGGAEVSKGGMSTMSVRRGVSPLQWSLSC